MTQKIVNKTFKSNTLRDLNRRIFIEDEGKVKRRKNKQRTI